MYNYNTLPNIYLQGGMRLYIENRIPPGGFLTAVLSNNLKEACGRADSTNKYLLFEIVQWLYNEVPSVCWGSADNVQSWLNPTEENN